MEIDRQGRVVDPQFHDGVIKSAAKLAYKDAQAILDGDVETRIRFAHAVETVELSAELGRVLNQARKDRGSLDFDLPEPELQLDPLGVVENITSNPRLFTMRMIEEFMLVANEAVAKALSQKGVATLYRIHESPDPDRLEEYLEPSARSSATAPSTPTSPIHRVAWCISSSIMTSRTASRST